MKKCFVLTCIFALLLTACSKPEPGVDPGSEMNDTAEIVVKKFLEKQLFNDEPERIMLAIDWNDDCSQILHVKHGLGYGSILDYDFTYYNDDSIRVVFSMPQFSYPMWTFWYDSIMIHLQQERIDSICCFADGSIIHVEHYQYDEEGRILERSFLFGAKDTFHWDDDNVVDACMLSHNYNYDRFSEYIHPHYNLPFYLSNYVAHEAPMPLFTPLWKYQPIAPSFVDIEADEEGYVTKITYKTYSDSLINFHTFYYTSFK
jgi:hypothetical protein